MVEDAGTYSAHVVTTSIIKSGTVPGLRPGAAALFSGGSEPDASFVIRLGCPPPVAVGGAFAVSVPARTESAAKVGHFQTVHRTGDEQVIFL